MTISIRRSATVALWAGCGAACTLAAAAAPPQSSAPVPPGHPTFTTAPFAGAPSPFDGLAPRGETGPIELPTASPLATGEYINYESPPVKPLAVSTDGSRLFAANTPAGTLAIINTSYGPNHLLHTIEQVSVGVEPVSVAIQPNSHDSLVWVANFISDSVTVVQVSPAPARVLRVIDVGDEPVNILFSPAGDFAYVVLQGPAAGLPPPYSQTPYLVTIDTASGQVVHQLALDCHTARAAIYDPVTRHIVVAALHSGNNTTVVGERIVRDLGNENADFVHAVDVVKTFSATAGVFGASSLAPFPDPGAVPDSPLVPRIVPDAGRPSEWAQVIDILTLDNGEIDPAMADLYAAETGAVNAADVLGHVVNDAKDTLDHDLIVIDARTPDQPSVERIIGNIGTHLTGMALRPGTEQLFISNLEPRNTTRLKPNLTGHFMDHQIIVVDRYTSPGFTRLVADLHAGIAGFNNTGLPNAAAVAGSLANPVDIVFARDGLRAFVAALGPGRVGVLNGANARVQARVNVGRGPRGLTIDDDRARLYVLNRTDNSVTALDISGVQPVVRDTYSLFSPEPAFIRKGRDFLFSTRFSNNFASSCAMCHIDADLDHTAWDLGDPDFAALLPGPTNLGDPTGPHLTNHPVKGPMTTLSLRGLEGHNAFHWRGDKPEFVDFNEAFETLLGGALLSDEEMGRFDDFIKTVEYPPNPFWHRNNAPKDPAAYPNGGALYIGNCNGCHAIDHDGTIRVGAGTDDAGMNLSGLQLQSQEVTQLRGLYKKFPSDRYTGFGLLHHGLEESEENGHPLQTFLKTFFRNLNAQQREDLISLVTAFPSNTTNVVGWQVRIDADSAPDGVNDVLVMISQNDRVPSRCDVIARGVLAGQDRGFVWVPAGPDGTPAFRSDADAYYALDELVQLAIDNGYLVFAAVPPGSGTRLGIDADGDGVLDAFDSFPYASGDFNADGAVNSQDFFDFLSLFFTFAPGADFNDDRVVNSQDFFDFLQQFFSFSR